MRDYTSTPLQLYTRDFTLKTVIDVYDSFVWTDVYCGYSDFELKMPNMIAAGYNIQVGDLLECPLSTKIMIVEALNIDHGNQNEVTVTYKGRSLESILIRRVMRKEDLPDIVPQLDDGEYVRASIRNFWDSIKYILDRTAVQNTLESGEHPGLSNPNRAFPLLGYVDPDDEQIEDQTTPYVDFDGMTVYDYVCSVLFYFGYGFEISFNYAGIDDSSNSGIPDRKMLFKIYNGKKRTFNQSENDRVIFSMDDDSTFKMDTTIDMSSYGNMAMVIGPHECSIVEDENGDKQLVENPAVRYTTDVYNAVSGWDRYEVFVDCSSIPNSDTVRDVPYSDEYIIAQMRFNAIRVVKSCMGGNVSYSPSIDYDPYKIYREHYYLGDLVNVIDDLGSIAMVRIGSFSQSIDPNGYKAYPNFESVSPIGGYRVLEQTDNGSDIARAMETGDAVRVTEQNNLELFDDTSDI